MEILKLDSDLVIKGLPFVETFRAFHLTNLCEDSLANTILREQRRHEIPSLTQEVLRYMAMLNIREEEMKTLSKAQYRRMIKSKMKEKKRQDLLKWMKSYKKIDFFSHKEENLEIRSYFKTMNLQQCRTMFSLRAESTKSVKTHQMSNKTYERDDWACKCGEIDTLSHILRCPEYEHLRESKDLVSSDEDIVKYFQNVIKMRDEAKPG